MDQSRGHEVVCDVSSPVIMCNEAIRYIHPGNTVFRANHPVLLGTSSREMVGFKCLFLHRVGNGNYVNMVLLK